MVAKLVENIFKDLNDAQHAAVECLEGPLLVLAGAGTGKTKVLTTRVANIINRQLAPAHNILAVTFTNKAANEMNRRINNLVQAGDLNIGTFHSIAMLVLRHHISYLSLKLASNFTIINQDEQLRLIKENALAQNIDIKQYPPKELQNVINKWKDRGILPHDLTESETRPPFKKYAKLVYGRYQDQLEFSNAVDFGDLLLYNNQLFLNNPDILQYWQDRFRYILIDEYQDTNSVQYSWARMLAGNRQNICCVGDDDQSIYRWRGAEIANILRFEHDFPNAKIIKLEQNYRSTNEILTAASSLIQNNKIRHGKTLWTDKDHGEKIKVVSCYNDREEANFIANEVTRLIHASHYKASDIAVLVRIGSQTRVFEEAFNSHELPYRIIGGIRFYERAEIRDAIAYIRISVNNNDNLALERIINVPKRAVGNTSLGNIKQYAAQHSLSLLDAITEMLNYNLLRGQIRDNLSKLVGQINNWRMQYENQKLTIQTVTGNILEESGYLNMLNAINSDEAKNRIENINEMLQALEGFSSIHAFIEHVSLVMENDNLGANLGGAINVMTIHAAKGLEFNAVFIPGMEEGLFPYQKSIVESQEEGLEEERRLAYVAITRAKQSLYLTYAKTRYMHGDYSYPTPSRFLAEIPETVYSKIGFTDYQPSVADPTTQYRRYFNITNGQKNPQQLNAVQNKARNTTQHSSGFAPAVSSYVVNKVKEVLLRPGVSVKHKTFGSGIIIRQSSDTFEVAFEKFGVKTVHKDYLSS